MAENPKIVSYRFGIIAEIYIIIYLFLTFHRIIAWRYKTRSGEIDIIARRASQLVFLEVKARKDIRAQEVLTSVQQNRISDASKIFLQKNMKYSGLNYRFDLIIFNSPLAFRHIKNSWNSY
jgi:putative endonuclease